MHQYPVEYRGREVGCVTVEHKGLYLHIQGTISMQKGLHRLYAKTGHGDVLLGVCRPEGKVLTIRKRISAKSLGEAFRFYLSAGKQEGRFLPIREDEPISCLKQLPLARFCSVDGVPCLHLPDQEVGAVGE